jgi:hypothetical protein
MAFVCSSACGKTQDTKNKLRRYASLIGNQFRFVRVDFLVDDNQKIYLGELTFCPGNAANLFFNDELQVYLGSLWSQELRSDVWRGRGI